MRASAAAVVLLPLLALACGAGGSAVSTRALVMTMNPVGGSGVRGTVEVVRKDAVFDVQLKLGGLPPSSIHAAHIHTGHCVSSGPVAVALPPVVADPRGNATMTTAVLTPYSPPSYGWSLNLHSGPDLTTPASAAAISCGDLVG